ncbi:hypothetical protein OV320_6320 [Actinobacteria bacterium OV320]|nr:hypothetical protein OV320_6320 [Actinobacteria bacterium OV320]
MPTAYSRCFDPNGARYGIPTYPCCPRCRLDVGYCIPRSHGICGVCLAAEEQCAA